MGWRIEWKEWDGMVRNMEGDGVGERNMEGDGDGERNMGGDGDGEALTSQECLGLLLVHLVFTVVDLLNTPTRHFPFFSLAACGTTCYCAGRMGVRQPRRARIGEREQKVVILRGTMKKHSHDHT
ncbi:hypothetical protein Pcinc_008629 [Petrolisthes cinctipes]|uniref:Uncharacterized protein n=1 Tax=Petrolisthes cinctipes TaxID=88211 RepID=A0AAE1KWA1_PETCI|nr:hypothetical protein Pcinc_008629 [Petrolisthes cinctipes]